MTFDTRKLRRIVSSRLDEHEINLVLDAATVLENQEVKIVGLQTRMEALDTIVRSTAFALGRHGVTDADDPGEAIDVLVADKDAEIKRLRGALQMMIRAYVNLLECGRDRIIDLGGQCDPVDVMEATTPELIAARDALQEAPNDR